MSIGATSEEILSQTLQGLAMGVQVRHIATAPLCFCSASDQVGAVLSASEFKIYSQIPVRNGDRTCGVLERAHCNLEGTVREAMKALDDSILVAAGAPLMEYLEMATNSGYRLVVDGGNVNAIVTRSDLQKLPVRVVVFTLITNLELLMADVIRSLKLVPPGWKQHLSDGRQEKVKEKYDKLSKEDFYVDELTCTDFCDKRAILKRALKDAPKGFNKDLEQIEELRNSVFHAGEYAQNQRELAIFVDRFKSARRWTDDLHRRVRKNDDE